MKRKLIIAGVVSFFALLGFSLQIKSEDRVAGKVTHIRGGADSSQESMYAQCGMSSMQGHEHQKESKKAGEEHSEHSHMQDMEKTREWLKSELGDKYDDPVPAASAEQLAAGKQLYGKNCASCHGDAGRGDGPAAAGLPLKPSDFTDPEHSTFYSAQGRLYVIRKGIQGTTMPGFESTRSEDDLHAVYNYIESLMASKKPAESHEGHEEHQH
jgi:mono/diheme cytochrome c family protein